MNEIHDGVLMTQTEIEDLSLALFEDSLIEDVVTIKGD